MTKTCGVRENDFGRSMIEMLGVLAIVGVLSVGGITGYQKAMTRYKVNKWTEDVALILQNFLKYSDDWKRIGKKEGAYTGVGRIAFNAGLFPSGWFLKNDVSNWVYNNLNSAIALSASPYNCELQGTPFLAFRFQIWKADGRPTIKANQLESIFDV